MQLLCFRTLQTLRPLTWLRRAQQQHTSPTLTTLRHVRCVPGGHCLEKSQSEACSTSFQRRRNFENADDLGTAAVERMSSSATNASPDFLGIQSGSGVQDIGEPDEGAVKSACDATIPGEEGDRVYVTTFGTIRFDVDNPPLEQGDHMVPSPEHKANAPEESPSAASIRGTRRDHEPNSEAKGSTTADFFGIQSNDGVQFVAGKPRDVEFLQTLHPRDNIKEKTRRGAVSDETLSNVDGVVDAKAAVEEGHSKMPHKPENGEVRTPTEAAANRRDEQHVPIASEVNPEDLPYVDQQLFGVVNLKTRSSVKSSGPSHSHLASSTETGDLSYFDREFLRDSAEDRTTVGSEHAHTLLTSQVKVDDLSFIDRQIFSAADPVSDSGMQENPRAPISEVLEDEAECHPTLTASAGVLPHVTQESPPNAGGSRMSDADSEPVRRNAARDSKTARTSITCDASGDATAFLRDPSRDGAELNDGGGRTRKSESQGKSSSRERAERGKSSEGNPDPTSNKEKISSAFDYVTSRRKEKATLSEHLDSKGYRTLKDLVPDFSHCSLETMAAMLKNHILFDDDAILAINKPYGISTRGGDASAKHVSVADILPKLEVMLKRKGGLKLHLVNSLEKNVTGVLVLAKAPDVAQHLKSYFAEGKAVCLYHGLTCRIPNPQRGIIDIPVTPGTLDGRTRMVLNPDAKEFRRHGCASKNAQRAITEYRILASGVDSALVEIVPKTDVKHQIRVHFGLGLRCPFLGDHKYSHLSKFAPQKLPGSILDRLGIRQPKVRNMALHLHLHSVLLPEARDGEDVHVRAPHPKHFKYSMKRLKLKKN